MKYPPPGYTQTHKKSRGEEPSEKGETARDVDEHDLGVLSVSRAEQQPGWLTKIRALATGTEGILELMSARRIRCGRPVSEETVVGTFIACDRGAETKTS